MLVVLLAAVDAEAVPTDVQLANGSLTFQLPAGWMANPDNAQTGKKGVYIYGKLIKDGNGNPIIPTCSFILVRTSSTDVVKLYAERRLSPPNLTKPGRVFTSRDGIISLTNAVGIKASFLAAANDVHDVVIVDALNAPRQLFVETVCESPTRLFPMMEGDFRMILGSMRFH